MDTQKRLEWLTNTLSVNGRILTLEDSRGSVSEWDSLGDVLLLTSLEEDFRLVVSADELAGVTSAKELFALMDRKHAIPPG